MSRSLVLLDITADDIANGRPKDPSSCPIAFALTRALGSANRWSVYVDHPGWWATSPRGDITIQGDLPARTRSFVNAWDRGRVVEPQQLKLWLGRR